MTLWTIAQQAPLSMDSPGKNTGVGCHFLLQGIFLIQESNPSLLHCRQILYHLSYREVPDSLSLCSATLLITVFAFSWNSVPLNRSHPVLWGWCGSLWVALGAYVALRFLRSQSIDTLQSTHRAAVSLLLAPHLVRAGPSPGPCHSGPVRTSSSAS